MPTPKPPKMRKPKDEREREARKRSIKIVDAIFDGLCNYAYGTRSHMPNGVDYTNFTDRMKAVGRFCHARPDWTHEIVSAALYGPGPEMGKHTPHESEAPMGFEGERDNELVVAIIKAAIGEAKVYFSSYTHEDLGFAGTAYHIEVAVGGDVAGKLRLKGKAADQVFRVFQMSRTTSDVERLEKALSAEKKRVEKMKDRLARLHALADPGGKDFE